MFESREPNIRKRDVAQAIVAHSSMLHLRSAKIMTPPGYEPMEVWAYWEANRRIGSSRIYRTRGYVNKTRRKYFGFDNELDSTNKHMTMVFSEDASLAAYVSEAKELGDYRDVIKIISNPFQKLRESIVLDNPLLHAELYLAIPYAKPFARMRFSRDNRKLMYFARPTDEQLKTVSGNPRGFVLCLYDFETKTVSIALDETICTKYATVVEWTPDGKGIIYFQDKHICWHRFNEPYHNEILTDCPEPHRISFSPDGTQLAIFLKAEETETRHIVLFQWPLVRAATSKHEIISLTPYRVFSVPERPWGNDGKQLAFNANYHAEIRVCILNVSTLKITSVPFTRPGTVVDVLHDQMLIETVSCNNPSRLWLSPLPAYFPKDHPSAVAQAICLVVQRPDHEQYLDMYAVEHFFDDRAYSAVFIHPPQAVGVDLSLVVMPWWGPETHFTLNKRVPVISALVNLGYAVLVVNYRKPFVEYTAMEEFPKLTEIGLSFDTHRAVLKILNEYGELISRKHIYLYGHKFGAFIATNMIINNSNFYKRCVLVRPLLEFPAAHLEKYPDAVKSAPHMHAGSIQTATLMVIDESYRKFAYQTFENIMDFCKTPFQKIVNERAEEEWFLEDIVEFFQNPIGNEPPE